MLLLIQRRLLLFECEAEGGGGEAVQAEDAGNVRTVAGGLEGAVVVGAQVAGGTAVQKQSLPLSHYLHIGLLLLVDPGFEAYRFILKLLQ